MFILSVKYACDACDMRTNGMNGMMQIGTASQIITSGYHRDKRYNIADIGFNKKRNLSRTAS